MKEQTLEEQKQALIKKQDGLLKKKEKINQELKEIKKKLEESEKDYLIGQLKQSNISVIEAVELLGLGDRGNGHD